MEHWECVKKSILVLTVSKSSEGVGFGVVFLNLTLNERLPDCKSIFDAELYKIVTNSFLMSGGPQSYFKDCLLPGQAFCDWISEFS